MRSESLKRAQQKYDQKRKANRKAFTVTFTKEETEEIDRVIKEHKIQKTDFIRKAIKALEEGRL